MSGAAFDCEATNLDWKAAGDALFVSDVPLFVVDSGELRNTAGIPIFGSSRRQTQSGIHYLVLK